MSLNDTADFQRKIHEFQMDVTRHLEMMAAAYIKSTNIPPEECELVIETLPDKMVYRFQRRQSPLALDEGDSSHFPPTQKPFELKGLEKETR